MKNAGKRIGGLLVLSGLVILMGACQKQQIENKCCKSEYQIITTKYLEPDSFSLYIPQAFTPNGDGRNDYFTPLGRAFTIETMVIKKGRKTVFEYSDHLEPYWDGGAEKDGTYDYFMKLRLATGDPIELKGSVCIIRYGEQDDRLHDLKKSKICECLLHEMIDPAKGPIKSSSECPEGSTYDSSGGDTEEE